MLKRLFTPLTLVNQLALIVLLATIIGVAGMAISARLVNGVQGSAHAINKAGSLRMQSYRLLAAIPLNENDQKLVADMTATVFSPELQNSARRDGQEQQLKALFGELADQRKLRLVHTQSTGGIAELIYRRR